MASKLQLDSPSQLAITFEDLHVSPIIPPSLYADESYASTSRSPSRSASPGQTSKPPRPRNCFILFRSAFLKWYRSGETRQQKLSQIVGEAWKGMSDEERQPWKDAANEEEALHKLTYPNYSYSPQRNGTPSRNTVNVGVASEQTTRRKRASPAARRRTTKTRNTEVGSRGQRSRANNASVEAAPYYQAPHTPVPAQFVPFPTEDTYPMQAHPLNGFQNAQPDADTLQPIVWADQYIPAAAPAIPAFSYMPPFPAQPQPEYHYGLQQPTHFDYPVGPIFNESAVHGTNTYGALLRDALPIPEEYGWMQDEFFRAQYLF